MSTDPLNAPSARTAERCSRSTLAVTLQIQWLKELTVATNRDTLSR